MAREDDIRIIATQEENLILTHFDEAVAFSLGTRVRDRALRDKLGLVVDVRTWDRPLFYAALPPTTGDNQHWVRRKANLVQRLAKSSYRVVLENENVPDFLTRRQLDPATYALAGGGFPIRVKGAGLVGCITVSGLPQRDDHRMVVEALCAEIGVDKSLYALPPA